MIWNHRALTRIDFRLVAILFILMVISLLIISSTTSPFSDAASDHFFTPFVKSQLRWYALGWGSFFFFAGLDYRKLREIAWPAYLVILFLLIGLYFVTPIQNVHRWYRIPFLGFAFQPSEYAKLAVVIVLSWFMEKHSGAMGIKRNTFFALFIIVVPFFLILRQPDLGTALVLYPIALGMFYFGGVSKSVIRSMVLLGVSLLFFVSLMFLGILSHEKVRPIATQVLKEYQYERLNPDTYHQRAAQTAIAIGGIGGTGWHKSEFAGKQWLPEAHTDSVFAAFGEEFGFFGIFILLLLFFGLIYFSFQVTALSKDLFGRLLSAGIAVYIAMHVIVNMGMMCGVLPITGVPLLLISYGGSSLLSTMTALGILQSIYSRRFMF